ncbi:Bud20p [Sugiyamaella lignohabitans]|uniref:Bud20p n=1 Tax=Sugiyamaella lignohabitans TaxID=796027 RepID=A0A161HFN9_9ASCO|nr:Bud20p [Sugiyamaella lignohabitans]ANB11401.1 Bud20p [Sugiyamaella lignohabitans]
MGRYSVMRYKTKRYTRDLDQILHDDLSSEKSIKSLEVQEYDETKPGLGQFYCIPCAKYFETEHAKTTHTRGKVHKRRLKDIRAGPYTKEEADAAAGADVAKFLKKKELQQTIKDEEMVKDILTKPVSVKELDDGLADMVDDGEVPPQENQV